jgi:hypothetical protein
LAFAFLLASGYWLLTSSAKNLITRPITALGNRAIEILEFLGGLGYLLRDAAVSLRAALFGKRGRRLGWANLWAQMNRVGVRSVPIVSLVLFCIGSILSLQMAPILDSYGVIEQVADIISIAIFRELGPLVAAIVLTGFAGASIAAEIGSMVVSEEIEALEAQAISPTSDAMTASPCRRRRWTSSGFCVGSAIQLLNVRGTGEDGRITETDVVRLVPFIPRVSRSRCQPASFRVFRVFTIVASIPSGCGS